MSEKQSKQPTPDPGTPVRRSYFDLLKEKYPETDEPIGRAEATSRPRPLGGERRKKERHKSDRRQKNRRQEDQRQEDRRQEDQRQSDLQRSAQQRTRKARPRSAKPGSYRVLAATVLLICGLGWYWLSHHDEPVPHTAATPQASQDEAPVLDGTPEPRSELKPALEQAPAQPASAAEQLASPATLEPTEPTEPTPGDAASSNPMRIDPTASNDPSTTSGRPPATNARSAATSTTTRADTEADDQAATAPEPATSSSAPAEQPSRSLQAEAPHEAEAGIPIIQPTDPASGPTSASVPATQPPTEQAPSVEQALLVPARRIFAPQPEYPESARLAGEEGIVIVGGRITPNGDVAEGKVLRGVSPALDRAALEAFRTWQFEPATRGGEPVDYQYRSGVRFTLAHSRAIEPEGTPLPFGGDFTPPVKLATPLPAYPRSAWASGTEGQVILTVIVDHQGKVIDVEVNEGLPHGITEASVAAVRKWQFKPAIRNGEPVTVYHRLALRFAP